MAQKRLLVMGSFVIAALCALYTFVAQPVVFVGFERLIEGLGWGHDMAASSEGLYSAQRVETSARDIEAFNLFLGARAIRRPYWAAWWWTLTSRGGDSPNFRSDGGGRPGPEPDHRRRTRAHSGRGEAREEGST